MRNSLKLVGFLLIAITLNSCLVTMFYQYDYGKKKKVELRYMGLREKQFRLHVRVSSDRNEIRIVGASKYNAPKFIEDSVSTVDFIEEKLSFPDGTVLEKKYRPMLGVGAGKCRDKHGKEIPCLEEFYTCDGFKKKLRKNKRINLKIVYDLDSSGAVTRKEKKYTLVKKKYYEVSIHLFLSAVPCPVLSLPKHSNIRMGMPMSFFFGESRVCDFSGFVPPYFRACLKAKIFRVHFKFSHCSGPHLHLKMGAIEQAYTAYSAPTLTLRLTAIPKGFNT